jgi:hypothetical protein
MVEVTLQTEDTNVHSTKQENYKPHAHSRNEESGQAYLDAATKR